MVRRSILFLSLAFAVFWTAPVRAGDQPLPEAPPRPVEARRVTIADAREALAKGTAVLVDVRGAESYAAEHAKGALSLPVNEVAARASELPKDKLIITYCT
jgi:3-mercaptopyruvate sulfurtransferase SseA